VQLPHLAPDFPLLKDVWAFVACEADKADLARLACGQRRLDGPLGTEDPIRIAIIVNFMELPHVNDISLETAQTFLQLCLCRCAVACTDFGHQCNLVTPPFEC
jgi:hypothetical protein